MSDSDMERHASYLQQAVDLKNSLRPPAHSFFRVVAIILYTLPYSPNPHTIHQTTGTNGETSFIGGAICAERAALQKLRLLHHIPDPDLVRSDPLWESFGGVRIRSVYVVADNPTALSPGLLCREFLMEAAQPDTPIIMSGDHPDSISNPLILPLSSLNPFPCLFPRIPSNQILEHSHKFALESQPFVIDARIHDHRGVCSQECGFGDARTIGVEENWVKLYHKVVERTARDIHDHYPIQFAAGVLMSNGKIKIAHQTKAVEFGSTINAISKLAFYLDRFTQVDRSDPSAIYPTLIIQVDQFGIVHPPVANARSYLFENGLSDVDVLVHDCGGRLVLKKVADLVPYCCDLEDTLRRLQHS